MCLWSSEGAHEPPIQLWMLGPGDDTRQPVHIDQDASVKDLVAVSAVALRMDPNDVQVCFSNNLVKERGSIRSIGMCEDAVYEVTKRPPELEKPAVRCNRTKCACYSGVLAVLAGLLLLALLAVLPLSCYGLVTYDAGCKQPICDTGGELNCCMVDRFGAVCTPRPDLAGVSCAAWRNADRRCQVYQCKYTRGEVTIFEMAEEDVFDGQPSYVWDLCVFGSGLGAVIYLAFMWHTSHEILGRCRSA